jgi:hypothetical protein
MNTVMKLQIPTSWPYMNIMQTISIMWGLFDINDVSGIDISPFSSRWLSIYWRILLFVSRISSCGLFGFRIYLCNSVMLDNLAGFLGRWIFPLLGLYLDSTAG